MNQSKKKVGNIGCYFKIDKKKKKLWSSYFSNDKFLVLRVLKKLILIQNFTFLYFFSPGMRDKRESHQILVVKWENIG
jgi:hypothetical protein